MCVKKNYMEIYKALPAPDSGESQGLLPGSGFSCQKIRPMLNTPDNLTCGQGDFTMDWGYQPGIGACDWICTKDGDYDNIPYPETVKNTAGTATGAQSSTTGTAGTAGSGDKCSKSKPSSVPTNIECSKDYPTDKMIWGDELTGACAWECTDKDETFTY